MTYQVGVDPHEDLRRFLQDQENLDELFAQADANIPEAVVHQPVFFNKRPLIGPGSRIDSFVKIEGTMVIGKYVHIASFAHIGIGGGETVIDDYAAVASGGKVISGSNMVDALTMSACAPANMQRIERKRTVISRFAVVLTNATVLPGVTLHEGAVLAAGSVATKDIPAWEIWGGVPARKIGERRPR